MRCAYIVIFAMYDFDEDDAYTMGHAVDCEIKPCRIARRVCQKCRACSPQDWVGNAPFPSTTHAFAVSRMPAAQVTWRTGHLHIIGELCHFLEVSRMVTALSWKTVILAVPVQAGQAARGA
jgi:hypothetical protein